MKRKIAMLALAGVLLNLTSCEAHILDKSYDVPWYVIAIPVALFTIIVLTLSYKSIITKNYKCPKCGNVFKPKNSEISATVHLNDARLMRCPKCGYKGFCDRE